MTLSLLIAVRDYLVTHALLPETGVVVVACSGGPDSLALLDILHQLTGPGNLYAGTRLHVAHLHHGLRGVAADEDARFVAATCVSMGIPCTIERIDGRAVRRGGQSLEAALRTARYAFLRRVAADMGAACIATGHTAGDQVETLVMHWLRGSGLAGAVGMRPRERDLIRPLLEATHEATRAYCAARGLHPRADASNRDPRFLRNRIRHELLPILREYNPSLDATLLRSAAVFAEDYAFIEAAVTERWAGVVRRETPHELLLDAGAYLTLPTALRRHLLRRVTARLIAGDSPLELRHYQLIDQLAHGGAGRGLTLPGGLWMQRDYDALVLTMRVGLTTRPGHPGPEGPGHGRGQERSPLALKGPGADGDMIRALEGPGTDAGQEQYRGQEPAPTEGEVPLAPGMMRMVPGTPWSIKAELLEGNDQLLAVSHQPAGVRGGDRARMVPEPVALLDYDALSAGLHVRTRQPGDRFQPLGLAAAKKLQDFMVDAHIPRRLRDTVPLVLAGDEIVWVAGYRISERARLTPVTRRVLRLELLTLA